MYQQLLIHDAATRKHCHVCRPHVPRQHFSRMGIQPPLPLHILARACVRFTDNYRGSRRALFLQHFPVIDNVDTLT